MNLFLEIKFPNANEKVYDFNLPLMNKDSQITRLLRAFSYCFYEFYETPNFKLFRNPGLIDSYFISITFCSRDTHCFFYFSHLCTVQMNRGGFLK